MEFNISLINSNFFFFILKSIHTKIRLQLFCLTYTTFCVNHEKHKFNIRLLQIIKLENACQFEEL